MVKLEKIAIQQARVTCQNPRCKAVFTVTLDSTSKYCDARIGITNLTTCPFCKQPAYVRDSEFTTLYFTPSELRRLKLYAKVQKVRNKLQSLLSL